jgi:hypothetical protein
LDWLASLATEPFLTDALTRLRNSLLHELSVQIDQAKSRVEASPN